MPVQPDFSPKAARAAYREINRRFPKADGASIINATPDGTIITVDGLEASSELATLLRALTANIADPDHTLVASRYNGHLFLDIIAPDCTITAITESDGLARYVATRQHQVDRSTTSPWHESLAWRTLRRHPVSNDWYLIEPGIQWFVVALEQYGCTPQYSCEGHPRGTYIAFDATETQARAINSAGYFSTCLAPQANRWAISLEHVKDFADRDSRLAAASSSWQTHLGVSPIALHTLNG